jgi:histidinol-phosphatase (PHP family)
MPWINYHSHSLYCDGKASPEEFIRQAIAEGFPAYGYSSHAPVPFASKWNMAADKLAEYLAEIGRIKKAYGDKIQVYAGLEIDYIEGIRGRRFSGPDNISLDFAIGSVHYIGQFPDQSYFCFDGQPEAFFNGIELLYRNDFRKAITAYFQSVMHMTEFDQPDIIGHLDKIKMHNSTRAYLDESEKWYTDLVEETLEIILQQDCIVEVNTRGLYKHNPPMLYPGISILKRIFQKNIPIILNSDAHQPGELSLGFSHAAELLLDIGFRSFRVLLDDRWQDIAFDQKGLLI